MRRNRTRRIRQAVAALVCLLLLAALGVGLMGRGPRPITKERWLAAKPGMTLAEVEQSFGAPGRPLTFRVNPAQPKYALPEVQTLVSSGGYPVELAFDPEVVWRVWRCDDFYLILHFRNGVLIDQGGGPSANTFWEIWRARLGL